MEFSLPSRDSNLIQNHPSKKSWLTLSMWFIIGTLEMTPEKQAYVNSKILYFLKNLKKKKKSPWFSHLQLIRYFILHTFLEKNHLPMVQVS